MRYISPTIVDKYPIQVGKLYMLRATHSGKSSIVFNLDKNKIGTFLSVPPNSIVMVISIPDDPTLFIKCLLEGKLIEVARKNLIPIETVEESL
jgi:hypothetical protein